MGLGVVYLGRFLRGQRLPLVVAAGERPDAAPTVRIYRAGTLLDTVKMPLARRAEYVFALDYFLDTGMTDGNYLASVTYAVSSAVRGGLRAFGVYGGVGRPPVVAVQEFVRPLGRAVVTIDEDGVAHLGYNPQKE